MFRFAFVALFPLLLTPVIAAAGKGLDTLEQKASYSFGVDFAKRLQDCLLYTSPSPRDS